MSFSIKIDSPVQSNSPFQFHFVLEIFIACIKKEASIFNLILGMIFDILQELPKPLKQKIIIQKEQSLPKFFTTSSYIPKYFIKI